MCSMMLIYEFKPLTPPFLARVAVVSALLARTCNFLVVTKLLHSLHIDLEYFDGKTRT